MDETRRTYNIADYAAKARAALEKLAATQQPGEIKGTGGKSDVIRAIKTEIQALLKRGYTAKQIASALREGDVFGILPKTITEIVAPSNNETLSKKRNTHSTRRKSKDTVQDITTGKDATTSVTTGTFDVRPDTDDL